MWKVLPCLERLVQFKTQFGSCPLVAIRSLLLRRWKLNVRKTLTHYLREKYGVDWMTHGRSNPELALDIEAGSDCLWYAMASDVGLDFRLPPVLLEVGCSSTTLCLRWLCSLDSISPSSVPSSSTSQKG